MARKSYPRTEEKKKQYREQYYAYRQKKKEEQDNPVGPASESKIRGRHCRQCDKQTMSISYYFCQVHYEQYKKRAKTLGV